MDAAWHGMTELQLFGGVALGEDTYARDLDLLVRVPRALGCRLWAASPKSWKTCSACRRSTLWFSRPTLPATR